MLHFGLLPGAVNVSSLEITCQRSRQSSGGVTGVGGGVSVGAGAVNVTVGGASVGGMGLHVAVGGGKVTVAAERELLEAGDCCRVFNRSVPVTIKVVMIEPMTVINAVKTAGFENTLFCFAGWFSLLIGYLGRKGLVVLFYPKFGQKIYELCRACARQCWQQKHRFRNRILVNQLLELRYNKYLCVGQDAVLAKVR